MKQTRDILIHAAKAVIRPLCTILVTLLIGMVIILQSGENPLYAYWVMFKGAFGTQNAVLNTLARATPLIFTGLAAAIASNVGIFNVGIEGQLYMGALTAAVIGTYCGNIPSVMAIPLCLIGAMLAAAVWAIIPGIISSKLNVNIFIMFFMMNNVSALLTEYLSNGPFKGDIPEAATARLADSARLLRFSNYADLSVGFLIAIALIGIAWFVMNKTKFGFQCSALGLNQRFGDYIGIRVKGIRLGVLLISAAIAGLAGAEPVMGSMGRFYANFSNNYGFTGISVGLLASNKPIGVVIFAIFFGALSNGGLQMAATTGISTDLISMLQALMIILISADFVVKKMKIKAAKGETKG